MEESIFQTFLFLAYFDIALFAITIANYAVSASYLGRETRLSRNRMERKRSELMKELATLKKDTQIAEVKEKIKKTETETKKLSRSINLLSWLGAVILPTLFFAISLASAMLGINSHMFEEYQPIIMGIGIGGTVIGFALLLLVVRTIDSAARRIPVPKLEACFEKELKKLTCKVKETSTIRVVIRNRGEDVAENVDTYLNFPPSFVPHQSATYSVHEQLEGLSEYPRYTAVLVSANLIHVDVNYGVEIRLTMPNEQGTYDIPVTMYERKIGCTDDKLTIVVEP